MPILPKTKSLIQLEPKLVIGLMMGTSMDGVDVALVKIIPQKNQITCNEIPQLKIETISTLLYPIPNNIKTDLNSVAFQKNISLHTLCKLNFAIGHLLSNAVNKLIDNLDINSSEIDLIGSHGQTVYHISSDLTEHSIPLQSTLQIGEPSVIAQKTRITTIADFRPRDIAAGGQGAPLISYADLVLFSDTKEVRLVQNIGGIANVTVLPIDSLPIAFDTGPGNAMIDLLVKKYFNKDYDENGEIAFSGNIKENWVDNVINNEPYFNLKPPKSTGRELFNIEYIDNILNKFDLSDPKDIISNFSLLTAKTIAKSYNEFVLSKYTPSVIILGGGGAYNKFILENIKRYLNADIPIKLHEDFGISTKFKEAIGFAILAYTSYYGVTNNVPSCTGAKEKVVLGKITPVFK